MNPRTCFYLTEESGGTIQGLTIRNAWADQGAVAITGSGYYTFSECLFMDNHATDRGGVWHGTDSTHITFEYSIFSHNTAGNSGGALSASTGTNLSVNRCTFVRNGAPYGGSLFQDEDASSSLTSTLLAWGIEGSAFDSYYNLDATFNCCDIYGNRGGDWVNGASGLNTQGNLSVDPLLIDPMASIPNCTLSQYSPLTAGANSCGTIGALSARMIPEITYGVDDHGTGMFATIQEALDGVHENATILLENGLYEGEGNRDLSFNTLNVTLASRSGLDNACILNADGSSSENHRHFDLTTFTSNPLIRDLTLTRGFVADDGGSVTLDGASCPTFENIYFVENTATNGGGAAAIMHHGADSFITFAGCTFTHNTSEYGGAIKSEYCGISFSDCSFIENSSSCDGGAIYLVTCAPGLNSNGNTFTGNTSGQRGGAFFAGACGEIWSYSNWTLEDNHPSIGGAVVAMSTLISFIDSDFLNNSVVVNPEVVYPQGGAIFSDSPLYLTSCIFDSNNSDYFGGGVYFIGVYGEENTLTVHSGTDFYRNGVTRENGVGSAITDCLFSGNGDGGAVFFLSNENPPMQDCLFWDNSAPSLGTAIYGYDNLYLINCTVALLVMGKIVPRHLSKTNNMQAW